MDARIDTSARAWTVVAAAFGAMFTVFGVAYSFGVFFDPMAREFGSGRAAAAAVFALTGFVYFSLGVVSGPVVDRVGPRRVLVVGAIAMSSGLLLTSRVHTLWAGYLTYGIGVGIGVACGHVPMVAVVGGWFERRRTFALGLAVAGIGTGTLVGGPLAGALISRYGWRTTYVIFGVASGILLLACAGAAAKPPVPTGGALRLSQSVRTAQFRTMYLAMVVMGMPLFHVLVFLVPFARSEGIGGGAAGLLIGIVGAASVVGRLGSARSAGGSDRSAVQGQLRHHGAQLPDLAARVVVRRVGPLRGHHGPGVRRVHRAVAGGGRGAVGRGWARPAASAEYRADATAVTCWPPATPLHPATASQTRRVAGRDSAVGG